MRRDARSERAQRERRNGALLAALTCVILGSSAASYLEFRDAKAAAIQANSIGLSPCSLEGVEGPVRCGTLEVPENPSRPDGRRIAISVAVLPATGGKALRDPIVPLMGGPGEDALSAASIFAQLLAPLRSDRDILLVDQRGTGRSAALRCRLYSPDEAAENLRHFVVPAAAERCAREVGKNADATQYGYLYFIDDLERIRRALGYSQFNLSAGSYGTRVAQIYIRTHPQSVRTVLFHSVVPVDETTPLAMAKAGERALELMLAACEADRACHAAYPNLREEFREMAARLEAGVRVSVPGVGDNLPLARGRVAEWFRSKLYRPADAAMLPWVIHRAHAGDWSPIADDILAGTRARDSAYSFGAWFTTTCNDDVAFIREQDVAPNVQGTFLGDFRVRQQQAACRYWPRVQLPKDYREPVRSPVPALFLSGDADAAGPLTTTEHAARGFSNRAEIVLRNRGHTEWNECASRLYAQFVRDGSGRNVDVNSCPAEPRPPFKLP